MAYHPYHERGHSLTTKRGKRDLFSKIELDPQHIQLMKEINEWQKEHRHLYPTLQEFSDWWKGVWADFNDNLEEILNYLESLCDSCLLEMTGCACEPTFHEKVKHYEKVMTSKTAKFEFPK